MLIHTLLVNVWTIPTQLMSLDGIWLLILYGGGPCYSRSLDGIDIAWNLQFGEDTEPMVYEAKLSPQQQDERILYDHICVYANDYFTITIRVPKW